MISSVMKSFSFLKDLFSCCKSETSTAVSPAGVHGQHSPHLSNKNYQILSDNSVTCTCTCCVPRERELEWKRRKAPEKDRSERQPLVENDKQLSTRPAPGLHPGGGKKSSYPRSANNESSFHSALSHSHSPIHTSPSPPKSPAHTAILRKQGEACVGVGHLSFSLLHLLVPKLLVPSLICGVLVEQSSAGDLFIDLIVQNDISTLTTIEPIKVDLEALAQAQKVGETLASMQGSGEPAERAALEIEQRVSSPHKMALWAAVFLLAAAAIAYSRYS